MKWNHAQQTNNNMVNKKPCKYNPTIEASGKRQKTKIANSAKSKKTEPKNYSFKGIIWSIQNHVNAIQRTTDKCKPTKRKARIC